jgi:hypothetical protein
MSGRSSQALQEVVLQIQRSHPDRFFTFWVALLGTVPGRDAVRFANGKEISLQWLKYGQRVEVLSLSSEDATEAKGNHQIRQQDYRRVFVG